MRKKRPKAHFYRAYQRRDKVGQVILINSSVATFTPNIWGKVATF